MILDRPLAEAEQLDLFALPPRTCADCGKEFQTSRPSDRCALCSSLRTGMVGAATVECPVCGIEHQVAVLSPTKLCDVCKTDLVIAESNVRADLDLAEQAYTAALIAMEQAANAATAEEVGRYDGALAARAGGAPLVEQRWAKTIAQGGALAALLLAHDAREQARRALDETRSRAKYALSEIEHAKKGT